MPEAILQMNSLLFCALFAATGATRAFVSRSESLLSIGARAGVDAAAIQHRLATGNVKVAASAPPAPTPAAEVRYRFFTFDVTANMTTTPETIVYLSAGSQQQRFEAAAPIFQREVQHCKPGSVVTWEQYGTDPNNPTTCNRGTPACTGMWHV